MDKPCVFFFKTRSLVKVFSQILLRHTLCSNVSWAQFLVKHYLGTPFVQTVFGHTLFIESYFGHTLKWIFIDLVLVKFSGQHFFFLWSNSLAKIFGQNLVGHTFWKNSQVKLFFFCFSLVKFTRFVHNFLSSLFGNNFWFIFIFFKFSSQHFSLWPQFPVKIYLGTLFGQSSLYGHSLFKILLSTLLVLFLGTFLSNPFWA